MLTRGFVGRHSTVISKERIQRPVLSNIAYTIQSKPVAEARKIAIFAAIFHKSPYGYHLLSLDASYTPIQAWTNIKHITPIRSIAVRDINDFKKVLNLPCFKTLQEIHLNDAAPLAPLPEHVNVIAYCNISILVLLNGLKESLKGKEDKNVLDNKTNTFLQPSSCKNPHSLPSGNKTKKGHNKHKNNKSHGNSNNNNINDENYNGIDNADAAAISTLPSHPQKGTSKRKGKKGDSNSKGSCKNDTTLAVINGSNVNGSVGGSSSSHTDDEDTTSTNNAATTIVDDTTTTSPNSKKSNKKRNKKLERAINRCVSYDTLLLFHPEMTINEYYKFCKASN